MLEDELQVLLGRAVRPQLVGDHDARCPALLFEQLAQQALGRLLVAPALDQNIEHIARLVDRPPLPVLPAGNGDHHLVKMPFVTAPRGPRPGGVGDLAAELETPLPHRLVADDDAADGQHLFHHAQAERKAEVQPDRVADDLSGKAVAGIGGGAGRRHAGLIAGWTHHGNSPNLANLTVPTEPFGHRVANSCLAHAASSGNRY